MHMQLDATPMILYEKLLTPLITLLTHVIPELLHLRGVSFDLQVIGNPLTH
jgi:hypothetical protein